jgi:hypothetical protein
MNKSYFQYFLQGWIFNIAVNYVINGLFGLLAQQDPVIAFGGYGSILIDFVQMCLYLGFFLTLLVTLGIRGDIKKEKVEPLKVRRSEIPVLKKLPANIIYRSLVMACMTFIVFMPLAIGLLINLQVTSLPYWNFVAFKAFYGAFMAAVVEPIVRLSALTD